MGEFPGYAGVPGMEDRAGSAMELGRADELSASPPSVSLSLLLRPLWLPLLLLLLRSVVADLSSFSGWTTLDERRRWCEFVLRWRSETDDEATLKDPGEDGLDWREAGRSTEGSAVGKPRGTVREREMEGI